MGLLESFSLESLTHWDWFAFALVCLVIELLISGIYFFWVASAAIAVGLLLWVFPGLDWKLQLLIFSLDAIVSIFVWRYFFSKKGAQPDVLLNRRDKKYVGRVFVLESPIENGVGFAVFDDTRWQIKGADMPSGQRVKVVESDNQCLLVEKD